MILLKGQTLCIPTLPRTQTVIPPTTTTTTTVTQTTVARTVATTLVQLVNTNNCVPYTIAAGDSCLGIAAKFSITLNELFLANSNLSCSNLQIGKTICTKLIATTSVTVPTTAIANVGSTSIAAREIINSCVPYTIVAGDTCWDIAKRFCFPLSDISVLNPNINCNNLQVGEVICVKSATNTAINTNPIVQPSLPSGTCVPYTVVAGDTCWGISNRYGLTVSQLNALNPNVNCANLQIGQTICVQGVQANSVVNPIVAPVAPINPIVQPSIPSGTCVPYTVVAGDTCLIVATRYGLTLDQFLALNPNVNCNNLQIGSSLCVQSAQANSNTLPIVSPVNPVNPVNPVVPQPIPFPNINNCVQYTIVAGDTCNSIIARYGLTLDQLIILNPLVNCDNLQIGSNLCVQNVQSPINPVVPVPPNPSPINPVVPVPPNPSPIINNCVPYTIVSGDTCWAIAKRFCFPLSDISVLNPNINCNNLQVGEVICVKSATNTAINTNPIVQPSLPSNINNCVPYTIVAGDTCNAIAARYGLTLDQLYVLNPNVNCPHLQIGSKLCVQAIQANSIINPIVAPVNPVTQSPILAPVVSNCVPYYVVSGDTCWAIATRYGLTVSQLNSLNPNVNCANLQIGQVMCVRTTFSG